MNMPARVSQAALGLALVALRFCNADAQTIRTAADQIAEIRKDFPCRSYPFPIEILDRERFRKDACSLVGLAMHQIALGKLKEFGYYPRDTTAVEGAIASDAGVGTWGVSIQVKKRDSSVTVVIDQQTGKMTFHADHPFKVVVKGG